MYPEIEQLITNFKYAVERYDVTGMLNCLSTTTGFMLTISEDGLSYNKVYDTLQTELESDETNQTAWRLPEPEGHGYALELILGTPSYSNETETGAIVTQTFEVYESATSPSVPKMKIDNGVIIWQVVMINGEWMASSMTIEYQTLGGSWFIRNGFGFTRRSFLN